MEVTAMSGNVEKGIDRELRIPARDGFKLAATLYEPQGPWGNDSLVLISSATAVPRSYYDSFARFLVSRGFAVLTYDYRGIGGSRPKSLRSFRASMHQWGEEDLAGVIDWAARHLQPSRLLAVGHSVGGQIVGLAENNEKIAALLIVASQSGYWRHWPSPARYRVALFWHLVIPVVSRLLGHVPGWLGMKEDLPGGVAREWAAWGRRPLYLLDGHDERRRGFDRFVRPIFGYSFEDDEFAPRAAAVALLHFYRNARVVHRHVVPHTSGLPPVGHFGFFRERFRDTLWGEAATWLERHGAVPSGSETFGDFPQVVEEEVPSFLPLRAVRHA
jgi:predicted alpha/beta hydrolase